MSAIELHNAVKEYQNGDEVIRALKGVDFSAGPGEMLVIIGPSGSGKSTLLNLIGLLDKPTEGTVSLNGDDVTGWSEGKLTKARKSSIGFVFQDFHLLPMLTAVENVELPTMWDPGVDRHDRAVDLLKRVGLGDRLDHTPDQLSGGQRQRVAIARSLINEPDILLADEPTGNLDQDTARDILDEFTRIKDDEDVAIVAVTHDQIFTEYTDRTIEIVDGVIQ
ncbi:ABC transporter ATP-binding protein [Haloferax volcanii]|uniref:ABC transporter ATP-binding protein n=1 Tax=Haloferax volcanii TaxID=2246 RepID=UPI0023D9CF64|nr:ABC transporter ATP-binding protein [Haloferax lucentense]WEL27453.1 ABC-type antimicrobial peptide transport system,ATPase component [Haloferax lucentense]